jgi:hypothetical protein
MRRNWHHSLKRKIWRFWLATFYWDITKNIVTTPSNLPYDQVISRPSERRRVLRIDQPGHQAVPCCIGRVVAARSFLVDVPLQHVLRLVRVVLQGGNALDQPLAVPRDLEARRNRVFRLGPAPDSSRAARQRFSNGPQNGHHWNFCFTSLSLAGSALIVHRV